LRLPAVAGQFYPRWKGELEKTLKKLIPPPSPRDAIGGVVPHAGYIYSGKTAGSVYALLPRAETYILLGPNHTGMGSLVAVSRETWQTPLGDVESDQELTDSLAGGIIDLDETSHRFEHSIEVQLPFLQQRFQGRALSPGFRIAAISMALQDMDTALEVGETIARAIKKLERKTVILASSDFTHYRPEEEARETDSFLIEAILEMDVPGFYRRLHEKNATVCGFGPIAAMLTACKRLGASKASLVDYSTSANTTGDTTSVVGYAGIIVER